MTSIIFLSICIFVCEYLHREPVKSIINIAYKKNFEKLYISLRSFRSDFSDSKLIELSKYKYSESKFLQSLLVPFEHNFQPCENYQKNLFEQYNSSNGISKAIYRN